MSVVAERQTVPTVPKSLVPDWELAQHLYFANVPNREIVKRIGITPGALRSRIARGKWLTKRTALTSTLLHVNGVDSPAKAENICASVSADDADQFRRELMREAKAIVKESKGTEPKARLAVLKQAADILRTLDRPADRATSNGKRDATDMSRKQGEPD